MILDLLVGLFHYRSIGINEAGNDSYWLTGLVGNAEYHVMMCAMNINGCGEQSSLVDFIIPLSLPGQ